MPHGSCSSHGVLSLPTVVWYDIWIRTELTSPVFESVVILGCPIFTEPVGKPVITASHSHIQEFDALNLTCSADNADRIIWKKDDASLQDDIILSADNTTITFFSVNRTDAGEYHCEGQNIASKSTSDLYTLTVSCEQLPITTSR